MADFSLVTGPVPEWGGRGKANCRLPVQFVRSERLSVAVGLHSAGKLGKISLGWKEATTVTSPLLQEICCSVGYPMAGNPAQYMMEKAFARAGLDWRYLTLEVPAEWLEDAVRGMRAMGFRGGEFVAPHQRAVVGCLDELTDVAKVVGAADCFFRRGSQLVGAMTVGKGVLNLLRERIEPAEKRAVVVGAGSSARAVAVELALAGAAQVTVVNRTEAAARDLSGVLSNKMGVDSSFAALADRYSIPGDCEIVVHATPLGMGVDSAAMPLDPASLRPDLTVVDLGLSSVETQLVREARARGCGVVDGLSVLVARAQVAFRLWTEMEADVATLREALEEFLGL
jgi:shikimate dehydrogenase